MNQISKILIAVISAVSALILIYFLFSKSNNFEHDKHPKDIEPKVNDTKTYLSNSAHLSSSNGNSNEIKGTTKRPTDILVDLKLHKNYKLFNNDRCGVHTGIHKVLNGKVTKLSANPWMVALVYFNEKTNTTSVDCAGTLISGKCDPLFSCVKSYGMEIMAGIIHCFGFCS